MNFLTHFRIAYHNWRADCHRQDFLFFSGERTAAKSEIARLTADNLAQCSLLDAQMHEKIADYLSDTLPS